MCHFQPSSDQPVKRRKFRAALAYRRLCFHALHQGPQAAPPRGHGQAPVRCVPETSRRKQAKPHPNTCGMQPALRTTSPPVCGKTLSSRNGSLAPKRLGFADLRPLFASNDFFQTDREVSRSPASSHFVKHHLVSWSPAGGQKGPPHKHTHTYNILGTKGFFW